MPTFTVDQRRARLVRRHALGNLCTGPDLVRSLARTLVGLHATDPVSVYLQVHARVPDVTTADVEAALYDRREVVRVLAMRRTMFVVDPADMPMLRAAVTDRLAEGELRRSASWLERDGVTDDGSAWIRAAGTAVEEALEEHGPMTARDLREIVPRLQTSITVGHGTKSEASVGMSTRVLFWLATVGGIVRGRPGGTIASSAWTWAATADWVGPEALESVDPEQAVADLARRYLAAFGPATLVDVQWWTGWTKTLTRRALAAVDAVEVEVETGDGERGVAWVLPGDDDPDDVGPRNGWGQAGAVDARSGSGRQREVAPQEEARHGVVLLAALDATPMGWKERAWYLGPHTTFPGPLFDRNGNVGPTVWADGEVVGAWGQRPDGEVAWRLFDDVPVATADRLHDAIAERARSITSFLGDVRVRPRFATPWQTELSTPPT